LRLAGRPTIVIGAPRAGGLTFVLAFLLVLSVLVAAASGYRALRPDETPHARERNTSIELADAYAVGGVNELRAPIDAGASAITANDVVAYYGSPRTPSMGVLGQHTPEEAVALLRERARAFDALNGERGVVPALHLVYGVAQPEAGSDGLHLRYVDDLTVRTYLDLARRNGFLLVLDLQIGHSTAIVETRKIERYLTEPDVALALDPEFALSGTLKPGDAIGALDSSAINEVQAYLAALAIEHGLPKKILVVHQFQPEMIGNAARIERREDVDLIIDMDGYGPADIKQVKYARFGAAPYAPYGGIKVFLEHDPAPMTEAELLAIEPRPVLFVYQ
jgi:nucleotide-binding universal stress UspA family protein